MMSKSLIITFPILILEIPFYMRVELIFYYAMEIRKLVFIMGFAASWSALSYEPMISFFWTGAGKGRHIFLPHISMTPAILTNPAQLARRHSLSAWLNKIQT